MVKLIYLNVNAENAEMSKFQEQEKEDDLSDQDESMFNEGALNAIQPHYATLLFLQIKTKKLKIKAKVHNNTLLKLTVEIIFLSFLSTTDTDDAQDTEGKQTNILYAQNL